MPINHPETLIKYCIGTTAEKILTTQSLRWSAPHLFSDPFELNHESGLNFDPHILLQASIKMAAAMIFAKDAPQGQTPLMAAIRRWRDEERFASPEEAEEVLKELLSQVVDQRQIAIDKIMTDWRRFTRNLRICCFSAKPDNLTAWSQYGDNHRGVAMRFRCGEFTALPNPKPVNYKAIRPEITTLKEQIAVIINNTSFHAQAYFYEKFTTKSPIFNAAQEWRCFREREHEQGLKNHVPDNLWFDDVKFERREITAVYFGIYTDTAVKRKIYDLVKEKYNQAKIFQTKAVTGKYQIEFERL
ncbi:MAG: DUF2971 domain-containing protein [Exilibacterium sp.]